MNNALRSVLFLVGGLVAGFVVASLVRQDGGEDWLSASASVEDRVAALERRLAAEADARRALSAEIDALRAALAAASARMPAGDVPADVVRGRGAGERSASADEGAAADEPPAVRPEDIRARVAEAAREARRRAPTPEELEQRRIQRLVDAGFTVARAEWIEQRTAELQMRQLEAQYEAARTGDPSRFREVPSIEETLRAELGDAEYERYLEATGRPTRVNVRNVLPSSPAERVGLRPGDEIVAYAGKRVFDMNDLNRLTLEGQPGETVVLEVLRDGQPMQLYVPRGPIGISGGGRSRFP